MAKELKVEKQGFFPKLKAALSKYWGIYLCFLPAAAVLFVFNYMPMGGVVVAFKKFYAQLGIWDSPWADPWYKWFQILFEDPYFWTVLWNTIRISLYQLIIVFPSPIILALIFNEIKLKKYKRVIQTILYLPHFLSWVILAGVFREVLGHDGMVNTIITRLGGERVGFLSDSELYFWFLILSDMWQSIGFASILYMAAIAGIDISPYEAARIDGASRWKIMWYVTLPEIIPTIVIQLILQVSRMLNGSFGQVFNTYSVPVYDKGDILETYLYRTGITQGQYELATALGLFKSLVGLALVITSNFITNKLTGEGIW